ncbi:MAG: hypothetical protein WCD42_02785 [Rhizomicrobium sp.]
MSARQDLMTAQGRYEHAMRRGRGVDEALSALLQAKRKMMVLNCACEAADVPGPAVALPVRDRFLPMRRTLHMYVGCGTACTGRMVRVR